MKHYIVNFYTSQNEPMNTVKIETARALSTKEIRIKLKQLGFGDVSLAWISGLK